MPASRAAATVRTASSTKETTSTKKKTPSTGWPSRRPRTSKISGSGLATPSAPDTTTSSNDHTGEDYLDGATTYDLILDIGGRNRVARLRQALTETGTLVIVGGEDGGLVTRGIGRQIRAMLVSPFIGQNLKSFIQQEHHTQIERLVEHFESGAVVPVIERTGGLPGVPDAIRDLEAGRAPGKIAVRVPNHS